MRQLIIYYVLQHRHCLTKSRRNGSRQLRIDRLSISINSGKLENDSALLEIDRENAALNRGDGRAKMAFNAATSQLCFLQARIVARISTHGIPTNRRHYKLALIQSVYIGFHL